MRLPTRLVACFACVAAACGPSTTQRPPDPPANEVPAAGERSTLASLERTWCMGWCPVYRLQVYRDGLVEYEAGGYVKTNGNATGQLTPSELAALDELFTTRGFMQMRDEYMKIHATDLPVVLVSYRPASGLEKTIKHYLGDSSAPTALVEIEDGFDRIVRSEQWIGTEQEREQLFDRHR